MTKCRVSPSDSHELKWGSKKWFLNLNPKKMDPSSRSGREIQMERTDAWTQCGAGEAEMNWKIRFGTCILPSFPGGSMVKHPPVKQEMTIQSLGWEDPLEKEMATHSSSLAWKIPWTEEPGGLQSKGSQRVEHDSDYTATAGYTTMLKTHSYQEPMVQCRELSLVLRDDLHGRDGGGVRGRLRREG